MRAGLLAIAFVLSGAPALAQTSDAFPPAISVTGEARISVTPDIAFVDAGVATDAKTAREASEANNATMTKVMAALKAANIEARDIQTSRLSLQPQLANRSGPPTIAGYRASNRVTVRINNISKVADVI